MNVLHVITGISRDSGGPSRSSQGLVAAECRAGVDAWIYSFDGAEPWIEGVRKFRVQSRGQGIRPLRVFATHRDASKPSDREAELGARGQGEDSLELGVEDLKGFDLVHIHGIWDPRLHNVAKMCRAAKVPYIIAPRGMLEPWSLKQKWLKKRIARFLYQDKDLKCAAALHATAESEAEQFRKLGFRNPVIISPNGVNVPSVFEPRNTQNTRKRVLFVSRMHPKKGVLELVEAWGRLGVRGQELGVRDWVCELVYTVNGDFEREYEAKVKAKVKELGLEDQFIFTGSLNDDAKWEAYRRADLFVLPTYSENFGIVVAEALWASVPVITTKGTPWSDLEGGANLTTNDYRLTTRCGWWIDLPAEGSNPSRWDALDSALVGAMSMSDDERGEMGERGRKLVEEKYTWGAVVRNMVNGYKEILK